MKKFLLLFLLVFALGSCQAGWNEDDKKAFYQACTETASTWASSPAQAKSYCDCVFEKMVKKYPVEDDALEHLAELAQDPDLVKCKEEVGRKPVKTDDTAKNTH